MRDRKSAQGPWAWITGWTSIVVVTVGTALSAIGVGNATGRARVIWITLVIIFAVASGTIVWARDKIARSERDAAQQRAADSEEVATRLMRTVVGTGHPLVSTLGQICAGMRSEDHDPYTAFIERILVAARDELGADRTENRAVFYRREDQDTLVCDNTWTGRDWPPRREWRRCDVPLGRDVLEFLDGQGEPVRHFKDLYRESPRGFGNPKERPYRTFISVRVQAGDERLGILAVDSPTAGNFAGDSQKGLLTLLGGLLGAGLAADNLAKGRETAGRVVVLPDSGGSNEGQLVERSGSTKESHDTAGQQG